MTTKKSILDEILDVLQGKKKVSPSEFITLIQTEKTLYDKLKFAGLNPTVEDVQAFFQKATPDLSAHQQIQRVQTIENLVTLEDITNILKTQVIARLLNGSFEFDLLHWETLNVEIDATVYYAGLNSCKFKAGGGYIIQMFNALPLNEINGISFRLRVPNLFAYLGTVLYYETGASIQYHECSIINTWEKKVLTDMDLTKKAIGLYFWHANGSPYNVWLDDIQVE